MINNIGKRASTVKLHGNQHIPWREQFEMSEAEDTDWVSEWLAEADEMLEGQRPNPMYARVPTPMPVFRRTPLNTPAPERRTPLDRAPISRSAAPIAPKKASTSKWDDDVAKATRHIASMLDQLGNGRR